MVLNYRIEVISFNVCWTCTGKINKMTEMSKKIFFMFFIFGGYVKFPQR